MKKNQLVLEILRKEMPDVEIVSSNTESTNNEQVETVKIKSKDGNERVVLVSTRDKKIIGFQG